ncbi:addiction module protein [Geoalkalibacter halelectricus]|uniref:addiction module protein n=1 Tax=Geoalkalibacter halelectricus TaxID=2847045 RepID=UPI003460E578
MGASSDIVESGADAVFLTDEQRVELDRRIRAYETKPVQCRCWYDIQAEYRGKKFVSLLLMRFKIFKVIFLNADKSRCTQITSMA